MGDVVDIRRASGSHGIHILSFTPLDPPRGSLREFFDVHIPFFRLRLFGCTAHARDDRRWVALPARPMTGPDGNTLRDEDGKVRYAPVVAFDDDKVRFRFSDAAIAALDQYAPGWSDQR
jgi:hypothetical protein